MRRGPKNREHPQGVRAEAIGHRNDRKIGELLAAELVADLDARGFGVHGVGNDLIERLLFFHDAQNRAQLAQVLKLGLVEQVLRARRGDRRLLAGARRVAAPRRRRRAGRPKLRPPAPLARSRLRETSCNERFASRALSALEKRVRSSGLHLGT